MDLNTRHFSEVVFNNYVQLTLAQFRNSVEVQKCLSMDFH